MVYNYRKFKNLIQNGFTWIFSFLVAWTLRKILIWPILVFLFGWLQIERTNNLHLNEINATLFETKISLIGTILFALLLLRTFIFNRSINSMKQSFLIKIETALLIVHLYYYWLYQSVYWWYLSPIEINYYEGGLIRNLQIVKSVAVFCILAFLMSEYFMEKVNESKFIPTKNPSISLLITLGVAYAVIWFLYLWSSIPNENFGFPAVIIFLGIPIIIFLICLRDELRERNLPS